MGPPGVSCRWFWSFSCSDAAKSSLCRLHRDRIKVFDEAVAGLEAQIAAKAVPWQRETDLLTTVPGFGDAVAQAWLAGACATRKPTA
jgi:hypothetical protein